MIQNGRTIRFVVAHAPYGKARQRYVPGQPSGYKDKGTANAESAIRQEWLRQEKSPFLKGTPLSVQVLCRFTRGSGQFKGDGLSLSAAGRKSGYFVQKKPDADNIAKTVLDALNGYAYQDDAQVVVLSIVKVWTNGSGCMEITINEVNDAPLV